MPELAAVSFIHSYTGLRPKLVDPRGGDRFGDFIVEESARASGLDRTSSASNRPA